MLACQISCLSIVNTDNREIIGIWLVLPVAENNRKLSLDHRGKLSGDWTIVKEEQAVNGAIREYLELVLRPLGRLTTGTQQKVILMFTRDALNLFNNIRVEGIGNRGNHNRQN